MKIKDKYDFIYRNLLFPHDFELYFYMFYSYLTRVDNDGRKIGLLSSWLSELIPCMRVIFLLTLGGILPAKAQDTFVSPRKPFHGLSMRLHWEVGQQHSKCPLSVACWNTWPPGQIPMEP